MFEILAEFRQAVGHAFGGRKPVSAIDLLLQPDIASRSYSVKDLIGSIDLEGRPEVDSHVMFTFQTCHYLLIMSSFDPNTLSEAEAGLLSHLAEYKNANGFLADKFERIVEIVRPTTTIQKDTARHAPRTQHTHHYALLKNAFSHLILSVERQTQQASVDEYFSSHILAQKQNLVELSNTARYVIEKVARSSADIVFMEGLPDLLLAFQQLFVFCKTVDMKFSKAFYDALRGFFSNRKFRNTSQQMVACLILRNLNTVL